MINEETKRIVLVAANPSVDRFLEVETITPGAIHRPDGVVAVAGGKGLNAARAAARLGGSVAAIALVGGHAGAWIGAQLAHLGIEALLVDGGGETRTCVSVLDRSTGRLTEFYERGQAISATAFDALVGAVATELGRGDVGVLAMSGSLPQGAPSDGYARLVRMAAGRGVDTIVDAHGEALEAALAARPTVVKVNAAEAGEVSGVAVADPGTALAAAHAIATAGAEHVIVTLGRDGAVAVEGANAGHLTSSADAGPYSVGSGDAFLAGLAVGLARSTEFAEAARLGMAAAIANTRMPGAAELDAEDVDRLLPMIQTTAV